MTKKWLPSFMPDTNGVIMFKIIIRKWSPITYASSILNCNWNSLLNKPIGKIFWLNLVARLTIRSGALSWNPHACTIRVVLDDSLLQGIGTSQQRDPYATTNFRYGNATCNPGDCLDCKKVLVVVYDNLFVPTDDFARSIVGHDVIRRALTPLALVSYPNLTMVNSAHIS